MLKRPHPGWLLLTGLLTGLLTASAAADPARANLSAYFDDFAGCALIETRGRYGQDRIEYRPEQCQQALSPCSTFKIPNALIGLENGAVTGPDHLKRWDGVKHDREINNRDHTLASAIEHSVVWYFQDLARDVGPEDMQRWLDRLEYGNRDISGGIDRFWLGSSLRIDAHAQLRLIKALWHDSLPFSQEHQQQVRDMLRQDSDLEGTLHGKTGSCRGDRTLGRPDHGWFIGWVDWNKRSAAGPSTTWFVLNIQGPEAGGAEARNIALDVLQDIQP